jgi:hypothetical protein
LLWFSVFRGFGQFGQTALDIRRRACANGMTVVSDLVTAGINEGGLAPPPVTTGTGAFQVTVKTPEQIALAWLSSRHHKMVAARAAIA